MKLIYRDVIPVKRAGKAQGGTMARGGYCSSVQGIISSTKERRAQLGIAWLCVFLAGMFPAVAIGDSEKPVLALAGEYVITYHPETAPRKPEYGRRLYSATREGQQLSRHSELIRERPDGDFLTESALVPFSSEDPFCLEFVDAHPEVAECVPNYVIQADRTPDDTLMAELWGHDLIQAEEGWDLHTGSPATVVAVIDTGIDYYHEDLRDNLWVNPGEVAGNGLDDDGNGYVDDVHGMNAIALNGDPYDDNGHGTHCAGTIAGVGNNGRGVVGVAWNVKIMALKFLGGSNGSGSLAGAIRAIEYMVDMKENHSIDLRISSNSWGGTGYSLALETAVAQATDAGIIFVAAAGNSSLNIDERPHYPSGYENDMIVSVAAVDQNRRRANFSNYGVRGVDIAAPGVAIMSAFPGNQYRALSGTSMATPHVAGLLALKLSMNPELSNEELIRGLYETAAYEPSLDGLIRIPRIINAYRFLAELRDPLSDPFQPSPRCTYELSSSSGELEQSVRQMEPLIQADEYGYTAISLPFEFPYWDKSYSSLTVSPNGVLYFGEAPVGMDYRPQEVAPIKAIAVLQADLIGASDPYGVRVQSDSDRVTVEWYVLHYSQRLKSPLVVQAVLFPDGRIELAYGIEGDLLEGLSSAALVGMTGSKIRESVVYSSPSDGALSSSFGLSFQLKCESEPETPQGISSLELRDSRRRSRSLTAGRKFALGLTGSGTHSLSLSLGGFTCSSQPSFEATSQGSWYEGRLPRQLAKRGFINVRSGNVSTSARYKGGSLTGQKRKVLKNSTRTERLCNRIATSLRPVP